MQAQSDTAASQINEYITFSVTGQIFCLEITQIREIRRWSPVTVLPHAPSEVLGVMNLRGAVIPIYDLAVCFGLGSTAAGERNVVIVTALDSQLVGLLAESVSEIISVSEADVQQPPLVDGRGASSAISGIVEWDQEMIRLVNLPALIGQPNVGEFIA